MHASFEGSFTYNVFVLIHFAPKFSAPKESQRVLEKYGEIVGLTCIFLQILGDREFSSVLFVDDPDKATATQPRIVLTTKELLFSAAE